MLKSILSIVLTATLFSCKEHRVVSYSTETLKYLQNLSLAIDSKESQKTLEILNKNQNNYKFAEDLKETLEDSVAIFNAQDLLQKGNYPAAKEILYNRISLRGYSEILETSLKRLDKAERLRNFITDSKSMDLAELSREFAQLKAHTQVDFKHIESYDKWLKNESNKISQLIKTDKQLLLSNLRFTKDLILLTQPNLNEVSLLYCGLVENEKLIPGYEDNLPKNTLLKLKTAGVSKMSQESYISNQTTLKDIESRGFNNLQSKLIHAKLLAKKGDIAGTITSLKSLEELINIHETYRREILKTLFVAKGWSRNSLVNQEFLDISYLLEMVYRVNQ